MTADLQLPDAVAFDCDGTIADTESLSCIAWSETLASRGVDWTEADFASIVGRPFAVNWAAVQRRGDLGDMEEFRSEIRARFRQLFEEGVEVHDDVVTSMRELVDRGVGVAVVSSSTRDHVERVLARAGVEDLVAHIVASGDTAAYKPSPEPYLAACDALKVHPSRCSGVEDTPTGARSSRAAGLWTVGVRRAHAVPELEEHVDVLVELLRPEHLSGHRTTGPD